MCGLPSSGKTTRCQELKQFLEEKMGKTVHVVGEDTLEMRKNTMYADSKNEKEIRGNLKSAVQRFISKSDVVILDSLNYIKGYRYELYCVTKAAQTPHCVVHCDINPTQASEWNLQRPEEERYTQEVLDGLVMRFEPPENRNRWDSPLFTVLPGDELPCQRIYDALYETKAPPPNKSTLSQPVSATNFLHELDKTTQGIVSCIVDAQKTSVPGDNLKVPAAQDKVVLCRTVTLGELQRIRRQFISYTKTRPVDDTSKLANMFVQYLNNAISWMLFDVMSTGSPVLPLHATRWSVE